MKYFDSIKEKLSSQLPMWLLIMLVAIWSVVIQDGYINRDGLLYLKQAYLIGEGNWKDGLALYPWPFFSILITIFHKVSGLHLQVVAHAVDLGLFGIAAWFYLKILTFIYKQKHIIFYGGIILLSFIPIMDDYVAMVLRDHGLWAGCIMGAYFYFKNFKEYSLRNSIIWQFGFLLAGLFRPEGLVFVILLPLWNFTQNNSQKLKKLVLDYSICVLAAILALFIILLLNIDLINVTSSSRLTEFLNRPVLFLNQLIKPLPIKTDNVYLSNLFENYSLIITYAVLLSVLIFKWVKGMSVLHGGLFFYSFFAKKKTINNYQKHIYLFLIVSFLLVSINLFNVYVLTNRYWGFHWWWILILITPIMLNVFKDRKINWFAKNIIGITFLFFIFNSLIDKNENLEKQVAQYIKANYLENTDFQDNERIKYYVNYEVYDLLKNKNNQSPQLYKLYKNENGQNLDPRSILKNFPEIKPKFILIQNVK